MKEHCLQLECHMALQSHRVKDTSCALIPLNGACSLEAPISLQWILSPETF